MTLPAPPPKGSMYLFDAATPALVDGSYQVTVETDVPSSGQSPTFQQQRYVDVIGPRFTVPASMVAACYPPKNGHGAYQNTLPQIILNRRALPWERALVSSGTPLGAANPAPTPVAGDAPPLPNSNVPWVALLLFEEGEYSLLRNLPLEQIVPTAVFQALGIPRRRHLRRLEAQRPLVESILPSRQELQLLAHVRLVNVDDRELNIAGGDGFFSVVVSTRMPTPGAKCRAVLVSLEERFESSCRRTRRRSPPTPISLRSIPRRSARQRSAERPARPRPGERGGWWRRCFAAGGHHHPPSPSRAAGRAHELAVHLRRPWHLPAADAEPRRRQCHVRHRRRARPVRPSPTPGTWPWRCRIGSGRPRTCSIAARSSPMSSPAIRSARTTAPTRRAACRPTPAARTSPTRPPSRSGDCSPPPTRASRSRSCAGAARPTSSPRGRHDHQGRGRLRASCPPTLAETLHTPVTPIVAAAATAGGREERPARRRRLRAEARSSGAGPELRRTWPRPGTWPPPPRRRPAGRRSPARSARSSPAGRRPRAPTPRWRSRGRRRRAGPARRRARQQAVANAQNTPRRLPDAHRLDHQPGGAGRADDRQGPGRRQRCPSRRCRRTWRCSWPISAC